MYAIVKNIKVGTDNEVRFVEEMSKYIGKKCLFVNDMSNLKRPNILSGFDIPFFWHKDWLDFNCGSITINEDGSYDCKS